MVKLKTQYMEDQKGKDRVTEFVCDKCNYPMHDMVEIGFLGDPTENRDECNPFTELMVLCPKCTPIEFLRNKKSIK